MKTYTIKLGDETGPIWGVLRIHAESKADALQKARVRLERVFHGCDVDGPAFRVYVTPEEISLDHITEDGA